MGEAVAGLDLSGADFISLGIPSDDRLRSGAARGGADSQDGLQCLLPVSGRKRASKSRTLGEDLASEFHERRDVDGCGLVFRAGGGDELEGAHAASSGITEAFDGVEVAWVASLPGEPRIDERIAETVGEGVREEARQAVERLPWQRRKRVDLVGQRHGERRDLPAAGNEGRIVFEMGETAIVVPTHCPDRASPEPDFGYRHGSLPHDQVGGRLALAGPGRGALPDPAVHPDLLDRTDGRFGNEGVEVVQQPEGSQDSYEVRGL